MEPATPPVLEHQTECQQSRPDTTLQSEQDICNSRHSLINKKGDPVEDKNSYHSGKDVQKVKRRGSKKKRSQKIDYEAEMLEKNPEIGARSKFVNLSDLTEHNTDIDIGDCGSNLDHLTEKEATVITEVLTARQARSRPQSRTEERLSPGEASTKTESYEK